MHDSGAATSVWVASGNDFNNVFPDAIKDKRAFLMGGFGGTGRINCE